MTIKEIILWQSYEEHQKFARELLLYPKNYPARIRIEKALNEIKKQIDGEKEN